MKKRMTRRQRWRLRRRLLIAKDPHCTYCRCEVVEVPYEEGKVMPDNAATLDHIHSRLSGKRSPNGGPPSVLACRKCNHDRARQEEQELGIEALRERSRAGRLQQRDAA